MSAYNTYLYMVAVISETLYKNILNKHILTYTTATKAAYPKAPVLLHAALQYIK